MNKALYSTGKTEWETPQEFFDMINSFFHFDVDVCATLHNAKCRKYFDKKIDGLSQPWLGNAWCNPPYGREIGKWVEKARLCRECLDTTTVMLLPSRTDTKWIHGSVFKFAHVIFLQGRLKFKGGNSSAPFPSMLAIWGDSKDVEKKVIELAKVLGGHAILRDRT